METAGTSITVNERPLKPHVDERRCSGCGRCVAACGERIFTLETIGQRKQAVLREGKQCSLCGKCVKECPIEAVSL